jgi:Xaa-Pro aminopeptidase
MRAGVVFVTLHVDVDAVIGEFSLDERERRWRVVRRALRDAGLDCLLVPGSVGGINLCLSLEQVRGAASDARYLTMLEDVAVVFPASNHPPVVVGAVPDGNSWIPEVRVAGGDAYASSAPLLIDALRELGMDNARIGVAGMRGGLVTHTRAFDGVIAHTALADVVAGFPKATFEDATDVIGFCRYQKGPEEIESLRAGSAIGEAGIQELMETAYIGIDEAELYANVTTRMVAEGGQYYSLGFRTGPLGGPYRRVVEPRKDHPVEHMRFFQMEFSIVMNGLIAQEMQAILFGEPPSVWKHMIPLHEELWYSSLELMRPGCRMGELMDYCRGFAATSGLNSSDILMHGRGYGNDGPLVTPSDPGDDKLRGVEFAVGNVFVWKPTVGMDEPGRTGNSAGTRFGWGGNVLVTEDGAVPLFKRPHGLVSIK